MQNVSHLVQGKHFQIVPVSSLEKRVKKIQLKTGHILVTVRDTAKVSISHMAYAFLDEMKIIDLG